MNRSIIVAGVIALVLLLVACETEPELAPRPTEPQPIEADLDLPYTSNRFIDIYYPETEGPWPTIVLYHGGEEHKNNIRGLARAVAEAGLVVFVPDYRDSPEDLGANPVVALEDAACAMRYARRHATDYGGRAERLVSAGWSLGGAMATIMALDGDSFGGDCLVGDDLSATAAAAVGLDGAYDMAELAGPDWQGLTALHYVEDGQAEQPLAFRLFTGQVEQLHRQGERFRDALNATGHDVTLLRQPELGHAAFNTPYVPGAVEAIVELAYMDPSG